MKAYGDYVRIKRYLMRNQGDHPFPSSRRISEASRRFRNVLADKVEDPSLKQIRLYDLRHYFGTMTHYKTKDIPYTKEKTGHRKVQTTLIYAQLVAFGEDEWTHGVSKTIEEACWLVEAGFEYLCDFEGVRIIQKRK